MKLKNIACLILCAPFILIIGIYYVAIYAVSLIAVTVVALYETFS